MHRILVIDDDSRVRDMLKKVLSDEGYEIMLAEDGKYGIKCSGKIRQTW
ncbi:MAG: hypothetical protein V2I97_05330 [Desulfococcaceae bacterium]|jgi:DNA-binding response OmpR family regulator|nr:hypothetical protein [Desulfococcaceae bacterium]